MATEYKIIYTYTGQSNTSTARSVSLSRFKKTGDTNRTIGQIKSITYEHWHTSTKASNWALRGRLVLSDNTTIVSNTVTHKISGTKVKYTNTFTNLPTPEQFAKVKTVQTLNSQGTTGQGSYSADLYWRANSDNPMRLIVTFVEEKPIVYAPKVDMIDVVRCNEKYEPDDEGTKAKFSLKVSLGNAAGLDIAQLRLYYAPNAYPVVGESTSIDLTSRIPELLNGITDDTEILNGIEFSTGATWYFAAVFTVGEENDVETDDMPRALSNLHISGEPNGGVCVCGYSQGTAETPMFESYATGYFYKGINGVTNYELKEVKTGGTWIDGKPIYRSCLAVNVAAASSPATIATVDAPVETWVSISGIVKSGSGCYPTTMYASSSANHRIWGVPGAGGLRYTSTAALQGTLIVEYTKSTEEVS